VRPLLLCGLLLAACASEPPPPDPSPTPAAAAPADTTHAAWARFFEAEGARGTVVVLDAQTGRRHYLDPPRAAERFLPASTFKVYNSLVALDTGAAPDVDSVFAWDGVERSVEAWNRDHSLRTGIAASAVWLYQELARRIGEDGYRAAFAREPYGNGDTGGGLDRFWLDGALRVSAEEQVAFLDRLRRGVLAFRPEHQAAVREILLLEEGDGYRLYGKTGWALPGEPGEIGWLVGWIERGDGARVYALNLEPAAGAAGFDMLRARRAVLDAVLDDLGLRPAGEGP
jgi:beta-lactamase class D